jgi:hypothetical protein
MTSALVGGAGAFVGYHIARLAALGGDILMTLLLRRSGLPWFYSAGGWPSIG